MAEQSHDYESAQKLKEQLEELEERAAMLDKKRAGALSNVR